MTMTRRLPGWRWLQPFDKLRERTKAAPRPRLTPRPDATAPLRPGLPEAPVLPRATRPEAAPCWWAIFRTFVRKLLVWPAFAASERMRPGFGRKRLSSSALIDGNPPKTVGFGE
ncbi:hypothetical protein ABE438_11440 [Bosea sp. TWI1241]|uniref:hypothetical protein n=1 Tax=Bosea sp. TWI1241 TaxID=3148904 RepID=UPI003207B638